MALEKIGVKAVVEGLGQFKTDISQMQTGIKNLGQRIKDSSAEFKKAGIALSAFGATGVLAIKSFTTAALEQERALSTLGATIENTGIAFDSVEEKILSSTAALQRKTNFGDEEQLRILSKMVPILGDVDKALAALPAVLDAATASGMDANSVANTLTRALAGQVNQARSVGIQFEATAEFSERLALVMEKVGGAAEANADPFTQLSNIMGDLKEVIGQAVLPILRPLIEKLGRVFEWLQNLNPAVIKIVSVLALLATAFATIGGPILLLLGFFPQIVAGLAILKGAILAFIATSGPVGLLVLAISGIAAGVLLLGKHWDTVWAAMKKTFISVFDTIRDFFEATWTGIRVVFDRIITTITSLYESKLGWLLPGGALIKAIMFLRDNWSTIWNSVATTFSNIWAGIKSVFETSINWIIDRLNWFIRGVNRVQVPEWVPVAGGRGINIPEIPRLATGGSIIRGGAAIVGERGPEMVRLPAGASVTPMSSTTNYNVTANYSNPQEPQSIKLDLEALVMMAGV